MSIVKLNNRGVRSATAFGSITGLGSWKFLSKQTASSSSTISFTSGIDSTYKEYLFTFKNIHCATEDAEFNFQGRDGGTDYDATITSNAFQAIHGENDTTFFAYNGTWDLAQSTSFQTLFNNLDADNDECLNGFLHLYNPSNTTFAKHFISRITGVTSADSAPLSP